MLQIYVMLSIKALVYIRGTAFVAGLCTIKSNNGITCVLNN